MLQTKITILLLVLLAGCQSASRDIARSASEIGTLAASSKSKFESIAYTTANGESTAEEIRDINAEATLGMSEQSTIIQSVDKIHENVTKVSDNTPWWASMLSKIATAAAIIGVGFLLWQTGLGYLIKKIVYSIGWFIPASVKREVALDTKNLDSDNPATLRESIAAKRASNDAYNAAWKLQRRK